MLLSFGDYRMHDSTIVDSLYLPLAHLEQDVHISFSEKANLKSQYYAFSIVDYGSVDSSTIRYVHVLITNMNKNLEEGDHIIKYITPWKHSHMYKYTIYIQNKKLNHVELKRDGKNVREYLSSLEPTKFASFTVYADISRPLSPRTTRSGEFNYMKVGLTEKQEKYCRCALHVMINQGEAAYPICASKIKTTCNYCGDFYYYPKVPKDELLAYATSKGLNVSNKSSKEEIISAIRQWKINSYGPEYDY